MYSFYSKFIFEGNKASGEGSCISSSACDVRGGALFSSTPSALIEHCTFKDNEATTKSANQHAEGGAIYSTDIDEANQFLLQTLIHNSTFTRNSATGYGGAVYVLNQLAHITDSQFRQNVVGSKTQLFADSSNAGGAIWYSSLSVTSKVMGTTFIENVVYGGWGGAVFVTDSPDVITIEKCDFIRNVAYSSYTFNAQGGALMVSHNTIIHVHQSNFLNNTASPRSDAGTCVSLCLCLSLV